MAIAEQVHGKFKMFCGPLGKDNLLGGLAEKVEAFVAANKIAPKSIGVEYLEDDQLLVMTLGYREDEAPYEVTLKSEALGTVEHLTEENLALLEAKLAERAADERNIICHELYVTKENEFLVVFMEYKA